MGNNVTIKRFIGGLMIGGLLLGGSGFALAATTNAGAGTNSTTSISESRIPGVGGMNSELLQSVLDSLVSASTITQAQADQIVAKEKQLAAERENLKGQMKNMTQAEREANRDKIRPERVDMFSQLVKDGTTTQEQADAIQTAIHDKMAAQRQEQISTALNGLVEKNTINSEQSTAILDKLAEIQTNRQAQMAEVKDMTPDQRQAYFADNQPVKNNPLAELVTAGIITQAQADQIAQVIPSNVGKGLGMHQGRGNGAGRHGKCGQVNLNK